MLSLVPNILLLIPNNAEPDQHFQNEFSLSYHGTHLYRSFTTDCTLGLLVVGEIPHKQQESVINCGALRRRVKIQWLYYFYFLVLRYFSVTLCSFFAIEKVDALRALPGSGL